MGIGEKLMKIQTELKAPKNLYNTFGKYKYRNAEGIYEAVKPFLALEKTTLILSDNIISVGDRVYVVATASLTDVETGETINASASAREALSKKGMDDSQITGTASSYARKYALNGLFLLDDTKDADTDENRKEREARAKEQDERERVQEQAAEKISMTEAKAFAAMLKNRGSGAEDFCKKNGLKKLSDMTRADYALYVRTMQDGAQ